MVHIALRFLAGLLLAQIVGCASTDYTEEDYHRFQEAEEERVQEIQTLYE